MLKILMILRFIIIIRLFLAISTCQSYKNTLPKNGIQRWITHLSAIKRHFNAKYPDRIDFSTMIAAGSMVEYVSQKGSKRVALVSQREGAHLKVINDAKKVFSIPFSRLTYHIEGSYAFGDLLRLDELLLDLKISMIEEVWESTVNDIEETTGEPVSKTLQDISTAVWGVSSPIHEFVTSRLMSLYGSVFYSLEEREDSQSSGQVEVVYRPLPPAVVQDNIRDRTALKDFKNRFTRANAAPRKSTPGSSLVSELPERVVRVLDRYEEALKQLMASGHPWVHSGYSRKALSEETISKGKQLLDILELAPSTKNARKVLEALGAWSPHGNLEKYIMDIRDGFDESVLEEAQFLLDNWESLPDADERLRVDLRHLNTYAIDTEGAAEVDDAVSLEILEDGREKVWTHIADVSRWVRPGSKLSLEAERRMSSVYMPDEKISMFPEALSTELLSLGAKLDSFALSCGMVLNDAGEMVSYEVCPSRIRVTRRLSFSQLDELLQRGAAMGATSPGSTSGEFPNLNNLGAVEQKPLTSRFSAASTGASGMFTLGGSVEEEEAVKELSRLNAISATRQRYRVRNGALDHLLRHKTECYLSVRRDPKNANNFFVSGYTSWSNGTSMSMVAEYMVLMGETLGGWCQRVGAPVWFKVQQPDPPLSPEDLELRPGEIPFVRSARIIKHLRSANDSRTPGLHCSSGAQAYVQVAPALFTDLLPQ